jgi:hypothetical protein
MNSRQEALEKFKELEAGGPEWETPCKFIGSEVDCGWFRETTLKHGAKRCFYQLPAEDGGCICTMAILDANDIDPNELLGVSRPDRGPPPESRPPCDCGVGYIKQGIIWWCSSCKTNFVIEGDD